MNCLARAGLAARGFVYLVLGWIAIEIARGHSDHQANSRGALAEIAQQPFGIVLLWLLAAGLASYAAWRLTESATGTATAGKKVGPRVASLIGGLIYLAFLAATVTFIAGRSHQTGTRQQVTVTAQVMSHTGGRWLVALVGVVVVATGLGIAVQGIRRMFAKDLQLDRTRPATRAMVIGLGVLGTVARGVVFAIAGALVVDAAVTFDAHTSTGLDGALHGLAHQPYGPLLLGVVAFGLIAFGLYGLAEARWSRAGG